MQPAITLRQKITSPGVTLGALLATQITLPLIETCLAAGLDYVIVDAEHFDHGADRIADACAFGRVAGFPVLLRPPKADTDSIRAAMDLGPCGLLLPMIESASQLDGVARGAYLPPRGQRRPGGPGNRWVQQFTYESFKQTVEDPLIIIPQIESPEGLQRAADIAVHPLTTALGAGPFDLSARLGVCGQFNHPDLRAALATIRDAATACDKPTWMIGNPETLAADGYQFLCTGDPMGLLQATLANTVRLLRRDQ